MHQQTLENLKRLGVTSIDPNENAGDLSVGKQQMIEIARAISTNAKMIIMDEPTAALTDREIESLFEVIDSLRKQGSASFIFLTEWKKSLGFATGSPSYGMVSTSERKRHRIPRLKRLSK